MARRHAPLKDEEGEARDEEGADDGGPHPQVLLHVRVRVPAEPRAGGQQEPRGHDHDPIISDDRTMVSESRMIVWELGGRAR